MFMVAYKVLGNDASTLLKHIILAPIGIAIIIVGTWVCVRSLRRLCWGYSMLETVGADKKRTYKRIEPLLDDSDYIVGTSVAH